MIRRILFAATVAVVASASQASAAPTTLGVRCGANEDRVWVYESLVDFNVSTKLKCGEQVEILDRVKGYVKIRTTSGDEGFVNDAAFPKSAIPPEPVDNSHNLQAQSQLSLASKARATSDSASIAAAPAPSNVAAAPPVASRPAPPTVSVAAKSPAPKPAPTPNVAVPTPAPAPTPAPTPTVAVAKPVPALAPQPKAVALSTPAPIAAKEAEVVDVTPAATPAPAATAAPAPPTVTVKASPAPTPAPAPAPAVAVVSTPAPAPVAAQPVATVVAVSAPAPAPTPARAVDPDADEVVSTVDTSTANCTTYFAAYGLSPNQFKWIEQNRKKAFPSVCPAPSPAMVDFVVIFTHDVDFYSYTMPTAVHHEQNGFSDWAPLSTVDNALMSPNDANKSHHEYVWVFHSRRGAYDPSAFSAHRKPLYAKGETNTLGSHGGFRTVMDALTYIETNGGAR